MRAWVVLVVLLVATGARAQLTTVDLNVLYTPGATVMASGQGWERLAA